MKMSFHSARRFSSAFTLIELLTVIAIIGILAAIIIPTLGMVREAARSAQCLSNLRQMHAAAFLFSQDHQNKIPTRNYNYPGQIWPYAYPHIEYNNPWGDPPPFFKGTIFECPLVYKDPASTKRRSYGINAKIIKGAGTMNDLNKPQYAIYVHQVTVPSQTIYFGDIRDDSGLQPAKVNGRHKGKMNVVFFDGHAKALELTPDVTDDANIYKTSLWLGGSK